MDSGGLVTQERKEWRYSSQMKTQGGINFASGCVSSGPWGEKDGERVLALWSRFPLARNFRE